MTTVVDASVATKWYFPEPGRDTAIAVLLGGIEGRDQLLAPDLLAAEFGNVLWKKVRRGECDDEVARGVLDAWWVDRPSLVATSWLAPRALGLATQIGHPFHDCLYVAAAIEFEAALATADARLARIAEPLVPRVTWIGEGGLA